MRAARAETGFAMDGFGMEGLGFPTETTTAQWELELTARGIYGDAVAAGLDGGDESSNEAARDWATSGAVLQREAHVGYLLKSLRRLSAGHVVLDASRCWLCYWIVHSLALLGYVLPEELGNDVVAFLSLCQSNEGGFGGGPGQASHLAPTYAAVCCLATIATDAATQVVDKKTMREFLMQCKDQNRGGFKMHAGGETVSALFAEYKLRTLRETDAYFFIVPGRPRVFHRAGGGAPVADRFRIELARFRIETRRPFVREAVPDPRGRHRR